MHARHWEQYVTKVTFLSVGELPRDGACALAKRAATLAYDHGEIALFLSRAGSLRALPHYARAYGRVLAVFAQEWVGCYRSTPDAMVPVRRFILDDLRAHLDNDACPDRYLDMRMTGACCAPCAADSLGRARDTTVSDPSTLA